MDIVSMILEDQPNYIREKKIDQEIFNALKKGTQSKGLYDVIKSQHISIDAIDFRPTAELEQAVSQGKLTRVLWLLELDPSLSFSSLEGMGIDYTKFGRTLRFDRVKHVPTLLDRNFDFTQLIYQGQDQLSDAIGIGDENIVQQLLESGVRADRLYRGRSMLDAERVFDSENGRRIRDLLIANGAHNDLGKLVRQETGVKYNSQCKIGKSSVRDFGSKTNYIELINPLFQGNSRSKASNYDICHASLLICTKDNKNSLDNCFASAPSCSSDSKADIFSKDNHVKSICCPANAKSRYNEMRCSGLDVVSSALMLKGMGFPETYGIPTLMLNTPEYQKLNEKKGRSRAKALTEPVIPNGHQQDRNSR